MAEALLCGAGARQSVDEVAALHPLLMPVLGFAPLCRPDARVLVLGSMPGVASLRAQQYYGHPRNTFWPIMGAIFGFDASVAYVQRVEALLAHRVAVWDVLAACEREGSLDADIERQSVVVNDFADFFDRHGEIRRVCFNGAMAESLFRRHVVPKMAREPLPALLRMPSTSPAHAGMALADKVVAWKVVNLRYLAPLRSAR